LFECYLYNKCSYCIPSRNGGIAGLEERLVSRWCYATWCNPVSSQSGATWKVETCSELLLFYVYCRLFLGFTQTMGGRTYPWVQNDVVEVRHTCYSPQTCYVILNICMAYVSPDMHRARAGRPHANLSCALGLIARDPARS
jgi:hypothetical protein